MARLGRLVPDAVAESYLRKFLAITLVITLVAAGAFGGFVLFAQQQQADSLRSDLPELSTRYASDVATEVSESRTLAASLARTETVRAGDTTAVADQLAALTEQQGSDVHRVSYVNLADGTVVAAAGEDTSAGAPWTESVSLDESGETVVTSGFELDGQRYLAAVSPVPGTADRAVAVTISVDEQLSFQSQFLVDYLLVVDSNGAVVADTRTHDGGGASASGSGDTDASGSGDTTRIAGFDAALSAARGGETGFVKTGDNWVGHAPVPGTELALLAAVPNGVRVIGGGAEVLIAVLFAPSVGLLLVGVTFIRRTSNTISDLRERAEALEDGQFDVSFDTDRRDELGDLSQSFDAMRDSLQASLTRAEEAQQEAESRAEEIERLSEHLTEKAAAYEATMSRVADGDLTARVDPESREASIQSLGRQFNDVLDELEATMAEVDAFAGEVADASETVADSASSVAAASDDVTDAMTDVSEAAADQQDRLLSVEREMENLSATVEEVASTSTQVTETAEATTEVAETGADAAAEAVEALDSVETTTTEAVEAFESLRERTDEVSEIVELIADIAEQTNMLALNANIEAARADIDGDGFAVVADEVKQLATQAQEHADEIDEIVTGIDADTEETARRLRDAETAVRDSADTVTEAREALETVVERTAETSSGMAEIDRATDDQAASAEEVSSMVGDVAEIAGDTDELTREARETARTQSEEVTGVTETAEALSERAARLDELLSTFELSASREGTSSQSAVETTERSVASGDD